VYGISSGGALALEAAKYIAGIRGVVVYEAPFIVDDSRDPITAEHWAQVVNAVATGERGRAVKLFLKSVGVPGFVLALFPLFPVWSRLRAAASTLPYDGALVGQLQLGRPLSAAQWSSVNVPTLVAAGGKSPAWLRTAMKSLAAVLPVGEYKELERQTHTISERVIAPVIAEFCGRRSKAAPKSRPYGARALEKA
jgi:pimeloyl-ACP methyl ester carboxylesterase